MTARGTNGNVVTKNINGLDGRLQAAAFLKNALLDYVRDQNHDSMTFSWRRRKLLASTLLALINTAVFACPPEDELIKSATHIIYADADIRNYVCAENTSCNFDEFFPKVTVTKVDFGPPGNPMQEGVLVEPSNRGLQYFSAIFLRRECAYHLAFSPDVTLSGVKILDSNHNGMRLIRSIERDSTVRWNEIDYAFDEHTKTYVEIKKRCYGVKGKAAVRVKCR